MALPDEKVQMIKDRYAQIDGELSKIIVGQKPVLRQLFICLLCGGHALIEGVPGLGKTLIVKSLNDQVQTLKEEGITILLSEQNLKFATAVGDRAYIIEKGRIVFDGTMQQIQDREDIRKAYLAV